MNDTDYSSYQAFWNHQARTPEAAMAAVDSSGNESVAQATGQWTARQVRLALDLQADDTVLELGCGVARIGRELLDHCNHWIGTDIAAGMLESARQRLGDRQDVELQELHRTQLEGVADGSVTKAYTVAVLCHMDKEDLFLYLQEFARVLESGGLAYLETWNLAHPIGWERWQYEVDFWKRSDQNQRKNVSRNQFCTPDEFALYVEKAGLQIISQYADSPWIQVVAGKDLDAEAVKQHQQRLAPLTEQIAYSESFSYLFGEVVKVIFGVRKIDDLLREVNAMDSDESRLYSQFVDGLWQANEDILGEYQPTPTGN